MDMPQTQIASRADFAQALIYVLERAIEDGTKELWLVDPDFEIWPLDDAAFLDALTTWARLPKRRAHMLAHDFDGVPRRQPRFPARRPRAPVTRPAAQAAAAPPPRERSQRLPTAAQHLPTARPPHRVRQPRPAASSRADNETPASQRRRFPSRTGVKEWIET